MVWMRGAYVLSCERGAGMESEHRFQDLDAGFAGLEDRLLGDIEAEAADSLRSSWKPVMPVVVPAILKSMSPKWSSSPRMSVMVTNLVISPGVVRLGDETRPQLMPATGATMGTPPASMSERQPPQIEAIEVEPFEAMISENGEADRVGEHVLGGYDGQERTFGERAVADFAAAGAERSSRFRQPRTAGSCNGG